MDIYKKRSYWNIFLAIFGLLILIVTLVYSNYLAQNLKEREEKNTFIYLKSLEELAKVPQGNLTNSLNQDIGVIDTIVGAFQLPIVLEGDDGLLEGNNWGDSLNYDQVFLAIKRDEFITSGKKPLEGIGYYKNIYYFNSPLISYIRYYPLIQILLLGSFILLGYFFLIASKKGEQNRVWAGMAKETAHQLGTPISAIIAWIEHLKLTSTDSDQEEIITELRNDVNRLELVADRFSKIGSEPVLIPVNIFEEMEGYKRYMERRASRNVSFEYPGIPDKSIPVKINKHLFDWVIENLIRNSLDAMGGKGKLSAKIFEDGNFVNIEMTDTGKGIPSSKYSTIFEPGFTTKQRGWGLGLSLAKRIIENYHNGKIFVKSSKLGEGTTFSIRLPKVTS